jgi:hypothetical protein
MLSFEVPSRLPVEDARKRVEALLAYWQRRYGVNATWVGLRATLSGRSMGVSFEGHLEVLPGKVAGAASDPGMLLRGQAQKYLARKFGHYLDPARPLDELVRGEG